MTWSRPSPLSCAALTRPLETSLGVMSQRVRPLIMSSRDGASAEIDVRAGIVTRVHEPPVASRVCRKDCLRNETASAPRRLSALERRRDVIAVVLTVVTRSIDAIGFARLDGVFTTGMTPLN